MRPWPVRRTCWSTSTRARPRRSRRPARARARSGTGGVATSERRELGDEALDRRRLRALVDAVQRRRSARSSSSVATASLAAIIRCSIEAVGLRRRRADRARDVAAAVEGELGLDRLDGERAALARGAPASAAAAARAPRRAAPPTARARAPRPRRSGRRGRSPGARRSGSASGRTTPWRSRAPRSSSSTVTASRSGAGDERAGVVGERLGQHRLDRPGDVDARGAAVGLAVDRRRPAARRR